MASPRSRARVQFSFDKYAEDLDAGGAAAGLDRFVLLGTSGSGSAGRHDLRGSPSGGYPPFHPGSTTRGPLGDSPIPPSKRQEAHKHALKCP